MDKFEQKEMKKKRPIKNNSYNLFFDFIPKPIRKSVGGFKYKVVSLFKTNQLRNTVNKSIIQEQSEDNIIKTIRNLFELKKENESIKLNY